MTSADWFFILSLVGLCWFIISCLWIKALYDRLSINKNIARDDKRGVERLLDNEKLHTLKVCKEVLNHIDPILYHASAIQGYISGTEEWYKRELKKMETK